MPPPPVVAPPAPEPTPFENPGGMWMPSQIPAKAAVLKRLGLEIDPQELSDPLSGVLASVVSLGGCSASFVSPDGLVVTNHHCAVGALQYNSTPDSNLLKQGFLARTRAEERSNGPTARVFVTQTIKDVSEPVRAALDAVEDDLGRFKAYEAKQKELVNACEKARSGIRCRLASFYDGYKYYLIEQLEVRDVRLVYAPPEGVGNFGGEVDNWRWPRHSGDFAFFRAYVGKDGKPADYAPDNVAYASKNHLRLASSPLAEGDLVLVVGYPGVTSLLKTPFEVEETASWLYPRRLAMFDEYIAAIEAAGSDNPEVKLKGTPLWRGLNNYRTKHKGELAGLVEGKLLEQKRAHQAALQALIDADPAKRARYGAVVAEIQAALEERRATREADEALEREILMPRLIWAASKIVRMAEERQKPDTERDPEYQERKWRDLEGQLVAMDKRYDPKLDAALLALALERLAKTDARERSKAFEVIAGKDAGPEQIRKAVGRLYAKTKLGDAKRRVELFQKSTPASLKRNPDSMIQLGVALHPLLLATEERKHRLEGRLLRLKPRYMQALLELTPGEVAPDANGTLRVTFGTVREPAQKPDASTAASAFTTVSQMVQKHTGEHPFEVPEKVLASVKAQRFGAYVHPNLGEVPVDFLSDLHITNGNSGSATLNGRGELVGLVFDGTYDSVASDWVFLPSTRSIHVDLRYTLWMLDAVENAGELLRELGVARQF